MPEKGNAEIATFGRGLNMREQLVALEHFTNTNGMRGDAPELATSHAGAGRNGR